jgi:hypothetical protein
MTGYTVERSITVEAPAQEVHRLVEDFHHWTAWSPWEDVDPDLQRTYSGPDQGVGARYAWSGNRKAGQGSMEITGSTPEAIEVAVQFLKPFKSQSVSSFVLEPIGATTKVTWRTTGEQKGMMAMFGRLVSMDKLIGPDFEKGLTRLKTAAERPA